LTFYRQLKPDLQQQITKARQSKHQANKSNASNLQVQVSSHQMSSQIKFLWKKDPEVQGPPLNSLVCPQVWRQAKSDTRQAPYQGQCCLISCLLAVTQASRPATALHLCPLLKHHVAHGGLQAE
jgi:hypothetical protein